MLIRLRYDCNDIQWAEIGQKLDQSGAGTCSKVEPTQVGPVKMALIENHWFIDVMQHVLSKSEHIPHQCEPGLKGNQEGSIYTKQIPPKVN